MYRDATRRPVSAFAGLSAAALAAAIGALASSCGGGAGSAAPCALQPTACASVGPGCQLQPSPAGTLLADPAPGDCQKRVCDGAGQAVSAADDADLPASSGPCTVAVCTAGVPSSPPRPSGDPCGAGCNAPADCPGADTACSARTCSAAHGCGVALAPFGTDCGGGLVCNGAGLCGCSSATDCPGTDTACGARRCQAQVCSMAFEPAGTVLPDATPGDCHATQCDGAGGFSSVVDDADVPSDGKACTEDVCTGGVPSHPPAPPTTACPGGTCDGAGNCPTEALNGCTRATATDLTAQAAVTITFPVGATLFQYSQPCAVVRAGTTVTFSGSFSLHPFTGGEVVGLALVPATSGPFAGSRATGNSASFTPPAGTWPYYCAVHGGVGMMGVVYVVP